MFHPLTIYGHENKGLYRKKRNWQMDKDDGIGHYSLYRVQLPVYTGSIARMDGSRHRVFQGSLQVSLQSRLPAGGGCDTFLHFQLSGFLKIQANEADLKYHLAEQGCPFGRPCLFPMPYGGKDNEGRNRKEKEIHTAVDSPKNYRAKLANASFRTARPGPSGFGEKSSSLRSGIFPESLAFPEAFAAMPL